MSNKVTILDEKDYEIRELPEGQLHISTETMKIDGKEVKVRGIVQGSEYFFGSLGPWFIINAMGWKVFFTCRDAALAQTACNLHYGVGKYKVRSSSGFKGAENVTCRANATRRGQAVQAAKARILNG